VRVCIVNIYSLDKLLGLISFGTSSKLTCSNVTLEMILDHMYTHNASVNTLDREKFGDQTGDADLRALAVQSTVVFQNSS